jgi:hypothetical protein
MDAIKARAEELGRPSLGTWGEHMLGHVVLASNVHLDDDEAYTLSRALETQWITEIGPQRAPLPLAEGDLLPNSPNVEEGSTSYRYSLIDDQGDAEWTASMSGAGMPMASISAAEMTGVIQTMQGGYQVSRKQLRNANKGRVRLVPRLQGATLRAHNELWDQALAWGKESIGIFGLLNHPLISFITAADKGGGATTWRGATVDQIVADVAALLAVIKTQTNNLRHATVVLLSERTYDYLQQTRINGDNGSLTILQHLVRIFQTGADDVVAPLNPVEFRVVRYLDATNARARGEIDSDAIFAYIHNDPDVVSRVSGFVGRAYPTQERDLMLITHHESEVGGVEMAQPLCCVRMDGVFDG